MLLEDTRRNRARGGFGGYKQAEYLAVLESSSANEADSSDDDQDVGSSTKSTGWPGDSVGARSHSSRASSFLSDADDNAPISETNIHAGDESHASGIAQKYLGHEDTKRLKNILRDDVAGSTNLRILIEDGAPSLGDKRTLWEKTNLSTHVGTIYVFTLSSLTSRHRRRPQNSSVLMMRSSRDCFQQYKLKVSATFPIDAQAEPERFRVARSDGVSATMGNLSKKH